MVEPGREPERPTTRLSNLKSFGGRPVTAVVRYQQESSMTKANFAIAVAVTFLYAVVLAVGDRGRGNG